MDRQNMRKGILIAAVSFAAVALVSCGASGGGGGNGGGGTATAAMSPPRRSPRPA